MHRLYMPLIVFFACSAAVVAGADIYEWTDENGVKHFSNYAPPKGSKVLIKSKEEPYDEAADRARMEAERQERLELARLEIAQRERELESREAEVDRRLAEADRLVEDALREADAYREEDRYGSYVNYWGGGYGCRGSYSDYGCKYRKHDRWYYHKKYRHSYHKRHKYRHHHRYKYRRHDRRYHYVKKHYGNIKRHGGHRYRNESRYRHKGHYTHGRLKSHSGRKHGFSSIGSGRGRYHGRSSFSRGRSGFGRLR